MFYETGIMGEQSLRGNGNFPPFCSYNLDLDPMTFIYKTELYFTRCI